jgi:hypothetical protein
VQARGNIIFDAGSTPPDTLGQWTHYAFIFDRDDGKVCRRDSR